MSETCPNCGAWKAHTSPRCTDCRMNPSAIALARAIREGRTAEELRAIADREVEHYRDAPRSHHA